MVGIHEVSLHVRSFQRQSSTGKDYDAQHHAHFAMTYLDKVRQRVLDQWGK